ncbi:kinase-like protein [Ophiobolus disseminans]|uniref:Kinase-like protein n=1 Tax=Ophiobolus disseminans TaxID=1469910 RepID=A0A6A6ZLY1_9PLEO|nr:kinase-like protein [Ophiobolus disseminans]
MPSSIMEVDKAMSTDRPHSRSLRDKIARKGIDNWKGQRFVPFYDLKLIVGATAVRDVIVECGIEIYRIDEAVQAVLNNGQRVFAILNVMGQERLILNFKEKDLYLDKPLDSGLPYSEQDLEDILAGSYREFFDQQWSFASPVFKADLHERSLPKKSILPFTAVVKAATQGYFAEASVVKIPSAHQEIFHTSSHEVELFQKKLKLTDTIEEDFHHEHHLLSMFRLLQHSNVVRLYAAFTFDKYPTLLFHKAQCDLKSYLAGNESIVLSEIETVEALYGLASALQRVHRYSIKDAPQRMTGCHFDLHPGNVLLQEGTFVLSDFGLSRLKYEVDGSKSYFKGGARDYYAPECQGWSGDWIHHDIGRPSDIWSMGCILAEVATFLQQGAEGVKNFRIARAIKNAVPSLCTYHDKGQSHEEVLAWLGNLESQGTASHILEGLVAIVRRMLSIEQSKRPDAQQVSADLFVLIQRYHYHKILKIYEPLLRGSDYGMNIEYERLIIWAQEVGLAHTEASENNPTWLVEPSTQVYYERIRVLLREIEENLDGQTQKTGEDALANPSNLRHHALRMSIDELWQTQPLHRIKSMNAKLETIILADMKGTDTSSETPHLVPYAQPQLLVAIRQAITATNSNRHSEGSFLVDQTILNGHTDWQRRWLSRAQETDVDQGLVHVLTELLTYEDSWINRLEELVARINSLVDLLSSDMFVNTFPVLRCNRFCHVPEEHAYGLIYEIPSDFVRGDSYHPLTLIDVIEKTYKRSKRPALGEVFKLAHTLAKSISSFHKAGWLHKSISPFNMVFFPANSESLSDSLATFRLIGFNYSRESDTGVFTVGPVEDEHTKEYRHPEYRKAAWTSRFREEFDYYSIGMVLLELGRWKSLFNMTKAEHLKRMSPNDLKMHLIDAEVIQLKSSMGSYYYNAVITCLQGFHSRERGLSSAEVWNAFDENVNTHTMSSYLRSSQPADVSGTELSATLSQAYGFISFLGLAQRLEVKFISNRWLRGLTILGNRGQGGQAVILEGAALAYKRFKRRGYDGKNMDFQEPVNELLTLTHAAIRNHPHVTQLKGLCWDFSDDNQVYPVLVFDMSVLGDLQHFMSGEKFQKMSLYDRLQLCVDVGLAIRDLHADGFVHGDIKPRNVIVFDKKPGYVAKVNDFGFTTRFRDERDSKAMPGSPIWRAPEWHDRSFSAAAAKKMDIFSWGLLCLSILADEASLEGVQSLQGWTRPTDQFISFDDRRCLKLNSLEAWKLDSLDLFIPMAALLINREADMTEETRSRLNAFFQSTLSIKPSRRNSDYDILMHLLDPVRSLYHIKRIEGALEEPQEQENFSILDSAPDLYIADFRLRLSIARELQSVVAEPIAPVVRRVSQQQAAMQLAICYRLGFGVTKDDGRASEILREWSLDSMRLTDAIEYFKHNVSYYSRLERATPFYKPKETAPGTYNHRSYYEDQGVLEEAERQYTQEIQALEDTVGPRHEICGVLKSFLGEILSWDRHKETSVVMKQVVGMRRAILGPDHPETWAGIEMLAVAYQHQDRMEEEEKILLEIIEPMLNTVDHQGTHRRGLRHAHYLAGSRKRQGRLDEAEEMYLFIIRESKERLGEYDEETLNRMAGLTSLYLDREGWAEVEQLLREFVESKRHSLGSNHPDFPAGIADWLRTAIWGCDLWDIDGVPPPQGVEIVRRVLGAEMAAVTFALLSAVDDADEPEAVGAFRHILGSHVSEDRLRRFLLERGIKYL